MHGLLNGLHRNFWAISSKFRRFWSFTETWIAAQPLDQSTRYCTDGTIYVSSSWLFICRGFYAWVVEWTDVENLAILPPNVKSSRYPTASPKSTQTCTRTDISIQHPKINIQTILCMGCWMACIGNFGRFRRPSPKPGLYTNRWTDQNETLQIERFTY